MVVGEVSETETVGVAADDVPDAPVDGDGNPLAATADVADVLVGVAEATGQVDADRSG